jgi:hypothetical protein
MQGNWAFPDSETVRDLEALDKANRASKMRRLGMAKSLATPNLCFNFRPGGARCAG